MGENVGKVCYPNLSTEASYANEQLIANEGRL